MIKGLFVLDPRWFPLVYGPPAEAQLEGLVEFVASPQSAAGIRERVELLQSVEVIFGSWGMALLDEAFLAAAPRLRAVFHGGGSVRYCTTDAFWRTEIALTTAAAINALPVAEYTLAAILFSLRRGFYYQRGAHRGGAFPLAISFSGSYGSTVGLISLGAVGRLVVERLRTFDLKVVAYDPFFPAAEAARLGVELVSLDELVARADVVSLHAPLLEETKGLLRGHHFASMKSGATFINTARGAVVNETEMITVLTERPDLEAVLDVTWPEPPEPGSKLYQLANVFLTPHIAATTGEECRRLGQAMIDEFHRWRRGEPLVYRVTKDDAPFRA